MPPWRRCQPSTETLEPSVETPAINPTRAPAYPFPGHSGVVLVVMDPRLRRTSRASGDRGSVPQVPTRRCRLRDHGDRPGRAAGCSGHQPRSRRLRPRLDHFTPPARTAASGRRLGRHEALVPTRAPRNASQHELVLETGPDQASPPTHQPHRRSDILCSFGQAGPHMHRPAPRQAPPTRY